MHPQYTPNDTKRFWAKVDRSGGPDACWLWTASTTSDNYGKFRHGDRSSRRAHIVSWEFAHGAVPQGLYVCHNCPSGDNSLCVNPAHLWLGDNLANLADRDAKGRQPIGVRNGRAKLTEAMVREVRRQLAQGVKPKDLAERFGVSNGAIWFIAQGRNWRHVT